MPRPASSTSTCTRSVRIRKASSPSTSARSYRDLVVDEREGDGQWQVEAIGRPPQPAREKLKRAVELPPGCGIGRISAVLLPLLATFRLIGLIGLFVLTRLSLLTAFRSWHGLSSLSRRPLIGRPRSRRKRLACQR